MVATSGHSARKGVDTSSSATRNVSMHCFQYPSTLALITELSERYTAAGPWFCGLDTLLFRKRARIARMAVEFHLLARVRAREHRD